MNYSLYSDNRIVETPMVFLCGLIVVSAHQAIHTGPPPTVSLYGVATVTVCQQPGYKHRGQSQSCKNLLQAEAWPTSISQATRVFSPLLFIAFCSEDWKEEKLADKIALVHIYPLH